MALFNEDEFAVSYEPIEPQAAVMPYAQERNTPMDFLHDLYVGSGRALELLGRGVGSETIQGAGESIMDSKFARPDISQYYGTEGRIKRVAAGVLQSAPLSLGLGAGVGIAAATGGTALGALAFGGGMGILGHGVYDESYEEISKLRPDLSEEDKQKYSWVNSISEVGSEAVGQLIPFGLGKMAGKAGSKAIINALVESGRITPNQAIGAMLKGSDGKKIVGTLFGGAVADGSSEVVNELIQAANKESVGLEENPVDLIDVFLIGSAPGGVIAGGTMALDSRAKSRVRDDLSRRLTSEDATVRTDAVQLISDAIGNIDSNTGAAVREQLMSAAIEGPVNLETGELLSPETPIDDPQKTLAEEGIPSAQKDSPYHATLRTERPEPVGVVSPAAIPPTPDATIQEGVELEMAQRKALEAEIAATRNATIDSFMEAKGPEFKQFTSEEFRQLFDEARFYNRDVKAAIGIEKGMAQVLEDTNTLEQTEDLQERSKIRKRIENTTKLIKEEIKYDERVAAKEAEESQELGSIEDSTIQGEAPVTTGIVNEGAAYISEPTERMLTPEELDRAGQLMSEGMTPDEAFDAITKESTAPVVKEEVQLPEGALKTVEHNGTTFYRMDTNTKNQRYMVLGKDGVQYAAKTEGMAKKAIEDGTVEDLKLYSETNKKATKAEMRKKQDRTLSSSQKEAITVYVESTPLTAYPQSFMRDHSSYIPEAIAQVAADGKELTKKNVMAEARSLAKAELNAADEQQRFKEGLSGETISADTMFAAQEREAVDRMDDVEAEDTVGIEEDTTDEMPTDVATVYTQKGKGAKKLKTFTYVDGKKS
jgi:hypothetical protein